MRLNTISGVSKSPTRLDARTYSGGDLDSSFPWVKTLVIAAGSRIYFRWSTSELNVTDAKWEVTDSPSGFSGAPTVVAGGDLSAVPSVGQSLQFAIDFKAILPAASPTSPKDTGCESHPGGATRNWLPPQP